MDYIEDHAFKYGEQYLGCVDCKKSHHVSSYCPCGSCFFTGKILRREPGGYDATFVKCKECGRVSLWD